MSWHSFFVDDKIATRLMAVMRIVGLAFGYWTFGIFGALVGALASVFVGAAAVAAFEYWNRFVEWRAGHGSADASPHSRVTTG